MPILGGNRALEQPLNEFSERLLLRGRRLDRHQERLDGQRQRSDQPAYGLNRKREDLDARRASLRETLSRAGRMVATAEVLASQMAGLENWPTDVAASSAPPPGGSPEGTNPSALAALVAAREEQARIRERFGAVTGYEDRIRRLEDALEFEAAEAAVWVDEAAGRAVGAAVENGRADGEGVLDPPADETGLAGAAAASKSPSEPGEGG